MVFTSKGYWLESPPLRRGRVRVEGDLPITGRLHLHPPPNPLPSREGDYCFLALRDSVQSPLIWDGERVARSAG